MPGSFLLLLQPPSVAFRHGGACSRRKFLAECAGALLGGDVLADPALLGRLLDSAALALSPVAFGFTHCMVISSTQH